MIGLSKICCAVLLLSIPFSVMANTGEFNSPSKPLTYRVESTLATLDGFDIDNQVKSFPLESGINEDTGTNTSINNADTAEVLLARAKAENAARVSMRNARLSDTECLATAMYHEARGEGTIGLRSVAFVIYNRVKSALFPKDYCSVVLQKSQFSFTADRHPDNIKEWDIYSKILEMSVNLIDRKGFETITSPVGNALFFDSFAKPRKRVYSNHRKYIARIGKLNFYR